jgi:hypothetical protein
VADRRREVEPGAAADLRDESFGDGSQFGGGGISDGGAWAQGELAVGGIEPDRGRYDRVAHPAGLSAGLAAGTEALVLACFSATWQAANCDGAPSSSRGVTLSNSNSGARNRDRADRPS